MALIVQVNTRIVSAQLGCIQSDNASYYDPTTGVNLNRGKPVSGDLSAFSATQLAHIANAVASGVLTLVSGVLPAPTATFALYNTTFHDGLAGASSTYAGTGVAAADALEPKNLSF